MRTILSTRRGMLGLVLLLTSSHSVGSADGSSSFKADGDYAYFSSWSGPRDESTYCWVYAARGRTDGVTETNLWYGCVDSPSNTTVLLGNGRIPNDDLKFAGNQAVLRTDTSSNIEFHHEVGTGGIVEVNWRKNALESAKGSGVYQAKAVGYSYRQRGAWAWERATATATMPGVVLADSHDSVIGFNKSVEITFARP